MDKKTFIGELKQALSVLKQEELDDIISEYEQHIDMKQANGLTEEDAIADFGSLDELAAEILEAYHVRADYAAGQQKGQKHFSKKGQKGRGPEQIKAVCAKAGAAVIQGARQAGRWLRSALLFGKRVLEKPIVWVRNQWGNPMDYEEDPEEYQEDKEGGRERQEDRSGLILTKGEEGASGIGGVRKMGRGQLQRRSRGQSGTGWALPGGGRTVAGKAMGFLADLCRFGIRTVFWGIRMVWNGACIGCALLCGGFGLFCLYCLGLLTVLLLQGYPLAGVTLGCVGLVMCSFSAGWLSITMLLKGRNGKKAEDREHA